MEWGGNQMRDGISALNGCGEEKGRKGRREDDGEEMRRAEKHTPIKKLKTYSWGSFPPASPLLLPPSSRLVRF